MKTLLWYLLYRVCFPNSRAYHEWRMLVLLNAERRTHTLRPLVMEQDLRRVARKHSKDMAQSGYFSHTNASNYSPSDRIQQAGISDTATGENLAFVRGHVHPTEQAMKGLMDSPGHRANILRPEYTGVGIGLHIARDGGYYYTQNFVARLFCSLRGPRFCRVGRELVLQGKTVKKGRYKLLVRIMRYDHMIDEVFLETPEEFRWTYVPQQTGVYRFAIFTVKGIQGTLVNEWRCRVYSSFFTRLFLR